MMEKDNLIKLNKESGKILVATLAGLGAGMVAGILLAPANGRGLSGSMTRSLSKVGDDLNSTMRRWTDKLRSGQDDDELVMYGSWDDIKGQLRRNYDELTEDDLDYQQGREHELFDRLQRRLGKTKDEIVRLLSEL